MKPSLATFFLLFFAAAMALAQTNVSGTINKDSTWTRAAGPYIVTGNVTVNSPFTLRVDSGVVVRFQLNQGLYINGTLLARHATFTSSKDTAGGSPTKGDWDRIQINSTGTATLDTCRVKWGGYSTGDYANIYVYGSMTIRVCDISGSKSQGVAVSTGGSVNIINSNVFQCDWPLAYYDKGSLVFSGVNNFTGNTRNGIYVRFGSLGSGSTMFLDTVDVPYVFTSYFYVQPGSKLEVASNNMLKFVNGGGLEVQGTLIAKASLGQQTRFTAYTDDNVGGDTNADGSATVPTQSYWHGITFTDSSVDSLCVLRRARITYAGYSNRGGITMYNANPTIDSCSMAKNYYGVMMQGTSSPAFSNNDIGTSTVVPIALSFSANPVFSNNTFSASDNQYDAIGILSETVIANSYLPIRSVTSIPNVTYLMLGTVTIPPAYTLTIQPGVVIKSYNYYDRLIIQGKLVAQGKADSTIVFTSVHDDQYGNPHDTNKNGNLTNPARGNWGGITFESTNDTTSIIKYAVLRYGNTPGAYYGTWPYGASTEGQITLINTSAIIENDTLTDNVYGVYAFFVSKPKIKDCVFINSQYTPIAMSLSANPIFSGTNSMQNPGLRALGIIGHYVSANGNLYQRTFAGYTNITYVVLGDVSIASGATITIDPGVVVKMNPYRGIYVDGALKAKGNIESGRVYFTSIKDDNVGNPLDTNGGRSGNIAYTR